MSTPFLVLGLISVAFAIVSSIAVTAYVSSRGVKVNYLLWRIMIFQYFNDYQRLTKQETGKVGPWSYVFIASMVLTFAFVVAGIVMK